VFVDPFGEYRADLLGRPFAGWGQGQKQQENDE
jgi:hypothetical protein